MSLAWLGTGKGGGLEYTTPLAGSILQSLCPLGDQHSWRTRHLRPWVTASATRTKTCRWNCGRTENWLHGGIAFEKGELTDSSEPTLPQLSFPLHVNSLVLSLVFQHPHLLPGVVMEPKASFVGCPFVQDSYGWGTNEDIHSWSWNKSPYATGEGRASGNEMHTLLLVTEIWQTPTQVVSWLWQERSLQSEAQAITSTVSLLALFSGVR